MDLYFEDHPFSLSTYFVKNIFILARNQNSLNEFVKYYIEYLFYTRKDIYSNADFFTMMILLRPVRIVN